MEKYENITLKKTCSLCGNWIIIFGQCYITKENGLCTANDPELDTQTHMHSAAGDKFVLSSFFKKKGDGDKYEKV